MHPILFKVGNFPIHTYGVMMVIAFFAGLWIGTKRAPRFGLTTDQIGDVAIGALIWGVLGARILFIVLDWSYYAQNTRELFSLQFQGLTSFGGVLFAVPYLMWAARRRGINIVALFDSLGPALLLGQAIGRIGCLLNGCCYGPIAPPGYPFGVSVEGDPFKHVPAQIYDTGMTLLGMVILLLIERMGWKKGQAYTASLFVYGVSRFIYEFWRAGVSSTYFGSTSLTDAQWFALLIAVCSLIGFIVYGRVSKPVAEPAEAM